MRWRSPWARPGCSAGSNFGGSVCVRPGLRHREQAWLLRLGPAFARRGLVAAFPPEVLAERDLLALVAGAQRLAVEPVRAVGHPVEAQLADVLAVLDRERDIVRPDLQGGPAPRALRGGGIVAEPRVEEPGVVGAKLAARRVIRRHLGGVVGRYPQPVQGKQQVEPLRTEDYPGAVLAGLAQHLFPEPARLIVADLAEVDDRAVVLGRVAHQLISGRAAEVQRHEQAVADR